MVGGTVTNERLSLCFKGDNRMDVSLLGQALLDMAVIADAISDIDGDKTECSIHVVALEFGSVDVVFDFIWKAVETILPVVTLANALSVTNLIKNIFEIKKHLAGEKPKSVEALDDYTEVVLSDGMVIRGKALHILFKDKGLDKAVSDISQISLRHGSSQGFSIKDSQGEVFFSKNDAQNIALPQEFADATDKNAEYTERLLLPINTLDLLGNSSWRFKYGKRTISAKIDDEDFLDAVHAGRVSVHAGDKLDVDLITSIKQSPEGEIISENYRIDHVYRLVSPPPHEQMRI